MEDIDYCQPELVRYTHFEDITYVYKFKLSIDAERPFGTKEVLEEILSYAYEENYPYHIKFDEYDWTDFEITNDVELDALAYVLSYTLSNGKRKIYSNLNNVDFLIKWFLDPNTDLKIIHFMSKLHIDFPTYDMENFFRKRNDDLDEKCLLHVYHQLRGKYLDEIFYWYGKINSTGQLQLALLQKAKFEDYLTLDSMYEFDPNCWYENRKDFKNIDSKRQSVKDLVDNLNIYKSYELARCDETELNLEEITKIKNFFKKLYIEHYYKFYEIMYFLSSYFLEELSEEINKIFEDRLYDSYTIEDHHDSLKFNHHAMINHLLKYFPDQEILKFHILIYGSLSLMRELLGDLTQSSVRKMVEEFLMKEAKWLEKF